MHVKHCSLLIAITVTIASIAFASAYTTVDLGDRCSPVAINDDGVVVGNAQNNSSNQKLEDAFVFKDRVTTILKNIGEHGSYAAGVTASGAVIGGFFSSKGEQHIFFLEGETLKDLGLLPGRDSRVAAGSSTGQIVGWLRDAAGTLQAFEVRNGGPKPLGTLGGESAAAHGVNKMGVIVGEVWTGAIHRSFSIQDAQTRFIDREGASVTAYAVNTRGDIVGAIAPQASTLGTSASTAGIGRKHAFWCRNGDLADLGTLGGGNSVALGVNSTGLVVGYSETSSGEQRAFVVKNGSMIDLNSLVRIDGVILATANAVNDRGMIVAVGNDYHGYLLIPNRDGS